MSLQEELSDELEVYHNLKLIPFAVDGKVANPLDWWRTHHLEFPKLVKLAWRFLCIIVSSVPCEQVFSKSCSNEEHFCQMRMCQTWYPLLPTCEHC